MEFTLKSRNELLLELKDELYIRRITGTTPIDLERIRTLLFVLNCNGFANKITERKLDLILKEEGLDTEDKFIGYWDY